MSARKKTNRVAKKLAHGHAAQKNEPLCLYCTLVGFRGEILDALAAAEDPPGFISVEALRTLRRTMRNATRDVTERLAASYGPAARNSIADLVQEILLESVTDHERYMARVIRTRGVS